jgi:drug/metabolite transporter (DMT)-like permease
MLAPHKQKTNIGVGVGLVLQLGGRLLLAGSDAPTALGVALVVAGLATFAWGCAMYSQGKGYHPAMGLLGLLSLLGLIVLVLMPDKHRESTAGPAAVGSTPSIEAGR